MTIEEANRMHARWKKNDIVVGKEIIQGRERVLFEHKTLTVRYVYYIVVCGSGYCVNQHGLKEVFYKSGERKECTEYKYGSPKTKEGYRKDGTLEWSMFYGCKHNNISRKYFADGKLKSVLSRISEWSGIIGEQSLETFNHGLEEKWDREGKMISQCWWFKGSRCIDEKEFRKFVEEYKISQSPIVLKGW